MFLILLLSTIQLAALQPSGCQNKDHCPDGFYCEQQVFMCRECLRCEDLQRQPPPREVPCVTSVVDCGMCFDGLVEDIHGDVNSPCVSASRTGAGEQDGTLSPLVWVAAALGGLFLVAVLVIAVCVMRNTDTFKVLASTRASVQTPPEPPPPYRAAAPSAPAHLAHDEESSWPFIKRSPPYAPAPGGAGAAGAGREHSAAQAARAYCNPAYVRPPVIPNSYEVDTEHEELDEPFAVHDEDTMESAWTPHAPHEPPPPRAASPAGAVVSAPDAELAPPAKRPCVSQDTNNNKGAGEGPSPSIEPSSSSSAPSFIISVVQNIHTVQQRNDVKL